MKKMNKTKAVELHLLENGYITPLDAIKEYGETRLSAKIFEFRKRGMNIRTEIVYFTDRYGNKGHYAKYILE